MKLFGILLLFFSLDVFSDECQYQPSSIANFNIEQILQYSVRVQNKSCFNTVIEDVKKDSSPRAKALLAALILYRCEDGCSDSEHQQVKVLTKAACSNSFIDACAFNLGDDKTKSKEEIEKLYNKYCEMNSANACLHIGLSLNENNQQKGDKYLQKACKLNSIVACKHLKEMKKIRAMGKVK